jgi:sigma-B regulation protein RsbU (phosphoserine phosphatase)
LDPAGYWAQHNIVYELANAENVDGVVSWASQIGTYLSVDEIRALHDRYRPLPVVTIGRTLEGFPGVLINSHGGMRESVT